VLVKAIRVVPQLIGMDSNFANDEGAHCKNYYFAVQVGVAQTVRKFRQASTWRDHLRYELR
jgi:hypothetical protein